MKRYYFWAVTHKVAASLLYWLPMAGIYTAVLLWLKAPVWLLVAVEVLLVLSTFGHTSVCLSKLINADIKRMNRDCDPYPLYETCKALLPRLNRTEYQQILINYCAALRNMGQFQEVYDLLRDLPIDRYSGVLPLTKATYYNNMADICFLLGRTEEALPAVEKVRMFYQDIRNTKQGKALAATVTLLEAETCFQTGDPARGLELAAGVNPENWCRSVDRALFMARCSLALGEREKAREALQFVQEKGNRLFAVSQARLLLEELA